MPGIRLDDLVGCSTSDVLIRAFSQRVEAVEVGIESDRAVQRVVSCHDDVEGLL